MPRRLAFVLVGLLTLAAAVVLLTVLRPSAPPAFLSGNSQSYYVAVVAPAMTSPFHVAVADGAKAEGARLGWRVEVQASAHESDVADELSLIQQMLVMGTQAISISSIQPEAIVSGVRAANTRHVPVLIHNSLTPLADGVVTAYVGYDQWRGAAKLGEYTCALLAKKYNTSLEHARGKVYILLGIEGFHVHRRTQGYKAGLALCPGVQVVGEQSAEWDREKGANVASAALQQTPDIDVFYGNSDEMAIGASLAAQKLGMHINQDFFVLSIDGNGPTLDLIKDGKFTASLGVDPTRMGETVIDTMNRVLHGEKVPQYILTPSVVVDAANVDDYIAGKTWTTPVAGAPEFDNGQPSDTAESVTSADR